MAHEITATWEQMADDAAYVGGVFFGRAVDRVDERFGVGYAEAHPELVAAVLAAMSRAHQASLFKVIQQEFSQGLQDLQICNP